jgi:4-carboxymuconolactone decarboxylase
MRRFISIVLAIGLSALASAQPQSRKLPPDIDPESLSRLAPVKRSDLDADGQRIYDLVAGKNRTTTLRGPGGVSLHSPKAAEPIHMLNTYLRNESVVGRRFFELCTLIAAREVNSQYEWTSHEPAALQAGVEQAVIDVVKFDRDVTGLGEKDATAIRLGRAMFRDHHVSSELYAKAVQLFGQKGTLELSIIMGDYAMAAVMLTLVDHQLAPDRVPLLPSRSPRR